MSGLPGPRSPLEQARMGIKLNRSMGPTLWEVYERWGPVVEMGMGRFRFVYLFGAEANEYLLATAPHDFTWREVLEALIPVDGETALVVSDGADHKRRRRIVQPAFHVRRIDGYHDIIAAEVEATIGRWPVGGTVDIHRELRSTIRTIVLRCLFGEALRAREADLGDLLDRAIAYVDRSPLTRFDHDWPGTPYRRAMKARRAADDIVYAEIANRRETGELGDDVLSWLIEAQDPDGEREPLSDVEVRDQVISLVAAGYDTTSAGAAWAVYALARDPEVWAKASAEVREVCGDRTPTTGELAQMPYVAGVVQEVLRLHSPALLSGRRASKAFDLLGHHIPEGSKVLYSQYVTHRLPELWPDPLRFDPERWVPGSPTFREPVPYSFVPFGGGYRRCIGFALATLELQQIVASVVQRTELVPRFTDPMPAKGVATMAPAEPVLVERIG